MYVYIYVRIYMDICICIYQSPRSSVVTLWHAVSLAPSQLYAHRLDSVEELMMGRARVW